MDQKLKIDISPEVSKGTYSNLAVITHSPTEMVFDFAQMLPGIEGAVVRDRIVMTPFHAKQLLMALNDNIQKYESQFGVIEDPQAKSAKPSNTIPYKSLGEA